jgi:5-hydroxyisourate hydrolase
LPKTPGLSLSTHVLDTERGQPAVGVPVTLSRWADGELVLVACGETDRDGRINCLGETLSEGAYQLAFDVAAYQRGQGREAPFLQRVVVEFRAVEDARHYHVPLLLSPYSGTIYRGS